MAEVCATRKSSLEIDTVSFNNLLLWLSAKGEGSWSQFRAAVEELHVSDVSSNSDEGDGAQSREGFPIYRRAQFALSTLCHVEFFGDNAWRTVPPTLAITGATDGKVTGVLCGARTLDLIRRLEADAQVNIETTAFAGMPDRILLTARTFESLRDLALSADVQIQSSAPLALLAVAPSVDNNSVWIAKDIPRNPGWDVQQFSSKSLSWGDSSSSSVYECTTGLFRFSQSFQRLYFLRKNSATYIIPVQVGKFVLLSAHRKRVLKYHAEQQQLSLPLTCRPPVLIERALVLCSGTLPTLNGTPGIIKYANVGPSIANAARQLLQQG